MQTFDAGAAAEARVARYLNERGYTFAVEPDLGIDKRPDFLVTAAGHTVVAEVKAFETYGMFTDAVPNQLMARSLKEALRPIRRQIANAAGQLRGLQDRGWPLVVVLDNPAGRPIPIDSPHMVISAMYGDFRMEAPVLADGSLSDFQAVAGRNGKLTNDHPYISAVAVVRREDHAAAWAAQWFDTHQADFGDDVTALSASFAEASATDAPLGDEVFLEIFETISPTAVPLPRDIFNGPRDLRWVPNAERTGLVPLNQGGGED
ncbi:hypothetical protein [Streptomyces cupreus]|uniref:Uncharacterized protein n=1 Tax=Streptomyces cupreus TaxID=2759956 RepID=A0A7X1JAR2_9ACTN|nr:hypothetical protein [Streptomyces cupreus]MBC2904812.1 hypothetical protein [Streptomyces cupreus]